MVSEVKAMSERQRYWHEHLRQADEQQVSLAAYAREQGLVLKQLYGAKTWLVKLGKWPSSVQRSGVPSDFVPVSLVRDSAASGLTTYSSAGTRCRVSHVSGWSLECDGLPSAGWLRGLVAADASA